MHVHIIDQEVLRVEIIQEIPAPQNHQTSQLTKLMLHLIFFRKMTAGFECL